MWHAVALLTAGFSSARAGTVVLVFFGPLLALNLSSVWYLSRRSFRDFAIQFEKETHSRLMQKTAQKKVLDELKN